MDINNFMCLFDQDERKIDAEIIHLLFELFKNEEVYQMKKNEDLGYFNGETVLEDKHLEEEILIPIFNAILNDSRLISVFFQELEDRFASETIEDLVLTELFIKLTESKEVTTSLMDHLEQFYDIYINLHHKFYIASPISAFWHENVSYLKNFGDSITPIVLNHLIKTIQQDNKRNLDIIINQGFFFLLTEEEMIKLFNHTEVNFFKALTKVYHGFDFVPNDSEFYWHRGNKEYVLDSIKDGLILQLQTTDIANDLLHLGFWEALDEYVLRNIPKSVTLYLIEEMFWDEGSWYIKILDESEEYISQLVYEEMVRLFRNCDLTPIYDYLMYMQNWFLYITIEDFEKLIQDEKINLFRILDLLRRNSKIENETWEELESLLKTTAPKFQNKLTQDLLNYMLNSLGQDRERMVRFGFFNFLSPLNVKKVKDQICL